MTIRGMGRSTDGTNIAKFTKRESELIATILQAKTTHREIAESMCISVRTVDSHVRYICEKTGARNIADIVLMAVGIVDCPVKNMPRKVISHD